MKEYIYIPLMCLALMSSTCDNDNDNHRYITFKNLSENDIYLCGQATFFDGQQTKCGLDRFHTLEKNSVFQWQPFNVTIEREMGSKSVLEFYFVNPEKFNEPNFYDCDSIPIKNDILGHYKLTLEDLRRMNWTVMYPPEE